MTLPPNTIRLIRFDLIIDGYKHIYDWPCNRVTSSKFKY